MCSDLVGLSKFCAVYSAIGAIFMGWIGLMLKRQPFFILGIEDVEHSTSTALGAMMTFLFTFLVSVFYITKEAMKTPQERNTNYRRSSDRRAAYSDVPQQHEIPQQEFALNLPLPESAENALT